MILAAAATFDKGRAIVRPKKFHDLGSRYFRSDERALRRETSKRLYPGEFPLGFRPCGQLHFSVDDPWFIAQDRHVRGHRRAQRRLQLCGEDHPGHTKRRLAAAIGGEPWKRSNGGARGHVHDANHCAAMTVLYYEPHEPGRDCHVDCVRPDQLVRLELLHRPELTGACRVVHEPDALPWPVAEERAEPALDGFDRCRHISKIDREMMVPGVLDRRRPPRNARNFPSPLQELFGERGPDAGSRSRHKGQPRRGARTPLFVIDGLLVQTISRCSMPLLRSLSFASLPCSLICSRTSLVESAKRSASS